MNSACGLGRRALFFFTHLRRTKKGEDMNGKQWIGKKGWLLGLIFVLAIGMLAGCSNAKSRKAQCLALGRMRAQQFADERGVEYSNYHSEPELVMTFPDLYHGVEVWTFTDSFTIDTEEPVDLPYQFTQEGNQITCSQVYLMFQAETGEYINEITMTDTEPIRSNVEVACRRALETMGAISPETYAGNHAIATVTMFSNEQWSFLLSQPATQGETGIWCVERWMDTSGNLYYDNVNADMTGKEYYADLQTQADEGHQVGLLDPEQVLMNKLTGDLGQAPNSVKVKMENPADVNDFGTGPISTLFGHVSTVHAEEKSIYLYLSSYEEGDGEAISRTDPMPGEVDDWDVTGQTYYVDTDMTFKLLDGTTGTIDDLATLEEYIDSFPEGEEPYFWVTTQYATVQRMEEQQMPN